MNVLDLKEKRFKGKQREEKKRGHLIYLELWLFLDFSQFFVCFCFLGLVMSKDVKWISFHGSYDFGYLLKLLTCQALPTSEVQFFELLRDFFPSLYDIKYILQNCPNMDSGISLQKVAELLDVRTASISTIIINKYFVISLCIDTPLRAHYCETCKVMYACLHIR